MNLDENMLEKIIKEFRLQRMGGGYIQIEKAETRPKPKRSHGPRFLDPVELAEVSIPEEKPESTEPIKHDPPIKHTIPRSWINSVEDENGYALIHCGSKDYLLTENYTVFLSRLGWIQNDEDK